MSGGTQVRCYFLILVSGKKLQVSRSNLTLNGLSPNCPVPDPGARPLPTASPQARPGVSSGWPARRACRPLAQDLGSMVPLSLPWFRLRALILETEALPCSGRSLRGRPGSYRMGSACHEDKHWTLLTWGHLPDWTLPTWGHLPDWTLPTWGHLLDWAPPRPRKGPTGPSSAGPLYPVRLLFIPAPQVWGFRYQKAWTHCPGLKDTGLGWQAGSRTLLFNVCPV